jgi:hypothetical protein
MNYDREETLFQQIEDLQKTNGELLDTIAKLQNTIESMKVCPSFGVLTRQAVDYVDFGDSTHLIFLDFDKMGECNAKWGYSEVDKKIKQIFSVCRKSDVSPIRWYSGDEFIVVGNFKALTKIVERLSNEAGTVGMSFTYALAVLNKSNIENSVKYASNIVQDLKARKKLLMVG